MDWSGSCETGGADAGRGVGLGEATKLRGSGRDSTDIGEAVLGRSIWLDVPARGGASLSDEMEDASDVVVRVNEGVRVLSSGLRYVELSRPCRGVFGATVYHKRSNLSPPTDITRKELTWVSDFRLTS